ncbi:MAG: PRD domain-containing protein [Lachnospiraceae bacterium]|nr:PRD domain-containing protein [Lachnospiraceae bacterium]
MRVVKRLNTNVAMAKDSNGVEMIILGSGVGFPKVPYELTDLNKVERTFYDIDPQYYEMIKRLPRSVLLSSAIIAELAESQLDCELNPNLPVTLADHLNFAIQRVRKGLAFAEPLAYDIKHLYPKESALGNRALIILKEHTGVDLPACEAVNVAMHIINAETSYGDIHTTMLSLRVIENINKIVEEELHFHMDKDSYHYSRFIMHLRYLVQRLMTGQLEHETNTNTFLRSFILEYPEVYGCVQKICNYLKKEHGWVCTKDEILYLMLHVNRVKEQNDRGS